MDPDSCYYRPSFDGGYSVGGVTYSDTRYIPGYEPVPVLKPDGSQLLDPDGDPVYKPSSAATLDQIADEAKRPLTLIQIMPWFVHNGKYDYQRIVTDDGKTLFMQDFTAYANIQIGYAFAARGNTWQTTAFVADYFAMINNTKYKEGTEMDKVYTSLPTANVEMYKIGVKLYNKNHGK